MVSRILVPTVVARLLLFLSCVTTMVVTIETGAQTEHSTELAREVSAVTFEVATVRPSKSNGWSMRFTLDGFSGKGVTLQLLVQEAFGAYSGDYVTGGPAWVASERFDVQAKLDDDEISNYSQLSLLQRRAMLEQLLVERFKLAVHSESHTTHGYAVQVAKGGTKLHVAGHDAGHMDGILGFDCSAGGRGPMMGEIKAANCSIADLSGMLCNTIAPKVIDQTGLTGRYDFDLQWTPEQMSRPSRNANTDAPDSANVYPPLFDAIREQLGLKLVPSEVPIEVIVVDHAEPPTDN